MLSSISPTVYLATLIVVCQLSLVYFVSRCSRTGVLNAAANAKETLAMAKDACCYIVILADLANRETNTDQTQTMICVCFTVCYVRDNEKCCLGARYF
jgi:hypothetical protein